MHEIKEVDSAIVNKEIEIGVINEHMLTTCIVDQGYKGEAGYLASMEPVRYKEQLCLRLELQNILRIDHLWILPNLTKLSLNFNKIDKIENLHMLIHLKELDLSFNYLEKIENLEKLTKLEILTFYSNAIEKIENLDSLTNLIILSIGKNKINTKVGIERLRFFKKLRSLNLEGNPIAVDPEYPLRTYLAAFLPQLKYYNYIYIQKTEREQGKEIYYRELRDLEENEKDEINLRNKLAKEKEDEIRLSDSFVEFLNEHQLFDSFFVDDPNGDVLLSIGEETKESIENHRIDCFFITQKLYQLGLEKNKIRKNEINLFTACIEEGRNEIQIVGQQYIDDCLERKQEIFNIARKILTAEETEDTAEQIQKVQEDYIIHIDDVWKNLMEIEINLFERVEESIASFGHTITDLTNEFIEQAQSFFVQLRDLEVKFCDQISEAVVRFITFKMATGQEDTVPEGLKICLEDKDEIANLVAGMRDYHMLVIDTREDRLISRARSFVAELLKNFASEEFRRNRNKVMEINYFIDNQRTEFENLLKESYEDADL